MGKYVCPKCGSEDVYEGTEIVSKRVRGRSVGFENEFGGTISREVGGGTTHKQITVVKCRECDTLLGEKDYHFTEKEILQQRAFDEEQKERSKRFWKITGKRVCTVAFCSLPLMFLVALIMESGLGIKDEFNTAFLAITLPIGLTWFFLRRRWRAADCAADADSRPEPIPILNANEAKLLLDFDIGKWNGVGLIKDDSGEANPVKYTYDCSWKEEGKSLMTSGTEEIDGQYIKFVSFRSYDETKGLFITRTKSESIEERISRDYYNPDTQTYHGEPIGSWGLPSKFTIKWTNQIIENDEVIIERFTYDAKKLKEHLEIKCTRISKNCPHESTSASSSVRQDEAQTGFSDSSRATHGDLLNPKCENIKSEGDTITFDCPHCGTNAEIDKDNLIRVWEESSEGLITCPVDECAKQYVAPTLHELSKLD